MIGTTVRLIDRYVYNSNGIIVAKTPWDEECFHVLTAQGHVDDWHKNNLIPDLTTKYIGKRFRIGRRGGILEGYDGKLGTIVSKYSKHTGDKPHSYDECWYCVFDVSFYHNRNLIHAGSEQLVHEIWMDFNLAPCTCSMEQVAKGCQCGHFVTKEEKV